jgi:hypothetical protein
MIIKLSPQRRDDTIEVYKDGDKLTINGKEYDFTQLPDGATLLNDAIDCEWIISDVSRQSGKIELTLLFPHEKDAPYEKRFPEPLVGPENGRIL